MKSEILVSITGKKNHDWQNKILELEKYKIKRCALFLTRFNSKQRLEIYSALLGSNIKEIPFVHSRHDMQLDEYYFLIKNFKTKYFNLHKNVFSLLEKLSLEKIKNRLLFELKYHNDIDEEVKMNKIKGFCIDLSHYKAAEQRKTNELDFVNSFKDNKNLFVANHLNGFSTMMKKDIHKIKNNKNFNYLYSLPKFIFGKYIALETDNSIKEQLEFKKYTSKILKEKIIL